MASLSTAWSCFGSGLRRAVKADGDDPGKPNSNYLQTSFLGSFPARVAQVRGGSSSSRRRGPSVPFVKCENAQKDEFENVSVERPPYYSYLDSTSGQLEPASGARAAIPGEEYWPEGTASRVRAARAPEPTGKSLGSPSYGKSPGSRRKKYKTSVAASESAGGHSRSNDLLVPEAASGSSQTDLILSDSETPETSDDATEEHKDSSTEYVVYQTEPEEEETGYDLDKKLGRPHSFINPKVRKPIEEPLTSEELWWNWRKPDKEQWSRWQRRRPDVETVFLKAMAETGQVKLYGDHPTLTETSLYRARRHLFKEERLQAEQDRLEEIGPLAYYSEWVSAWKQDTSREAVQKHFEETGEDENTQLIEMFQHQTDREYRIMMGTDMRIPRDPLAMRMREDQIKQIWGGDPVYPTINYIQDPNEIIDYRGPDFHEPTPNMLAHLKEQGKIISREELEKILAKEKTEEIEITDMDEAMARAVDIGENDEGEDSEIEGEQEQEKITRNWSVLKSTPELSKSKDKKPKMDGRMSLEQAVEDSENLTDFLLDFEEDE
ncbi:protein PLASTID TRANSCRIPTIONALLY ACTIVE 12, chloroplastic isoform X2 [Rhodamnia argentea]|uniref:Protein PLASTID TRANSCRIPTIONALLY ACTIVE 12, chloroplastic isoform X2 n=1 Tax=Rhodamnia argentea TaxID=178133 RepID=A0A8B8R4B6_9MYRT|nr:protein PLASTID TRANSCRIPTIONALLY ACTIVE 12, chloroplastic isoform X2 [Rhodamnia argentea]